jgi:hypothetical protein
VDSVFVGIARIIVVLSGFVTLLALALLVAIWQGVGLEVLMDLGAVIGNRPGTQVTAQQYTGHLLSVVIISLSGVTLLATVIGAAATFGLVSHARSLKRDIQDEIVSESHKVFSSMASIETVFVQSQSSLDTAVYEWQSRSAWIDDPEEKKRAITRGYIAASSARNEVEAAQRRLSREASSHQHVQAVQDHISEVRRLLNRLQANIQNTLAFYLASLEQEGLLDQESLISRGLIPEKDVAQNEAVVLIAKALEIYDSDDFTSEFPMERCQMEETALFVHYRMQLENDVLLSSRLNELSDLVKETRFKLTTKEERDSLDKWWLDRQQEYEDLKLSVGEDETESDDENEKPSH